MIEVRSDVVDESQIDTVFPKGMVFSGRVTLRKPFLVKGRIEGSIVSTSDVYVDEGAEVNADIVADVVVIKGRVVGAVTALHTIELLAEGSVEGDLEAPAISLEPGCRHVGDLCLAETVPNG